MENINVYSEYLYYFSKLKNQNVEHELTHHRDNWRLAHIFAKTIVEF